jgi:selenocysteine-specific translation elongation factor
MSSITDLLETAVKHLDCLTAGQHPFIKEALSELMKIESQNITEDLSSPQTEIEALRARIAELEARINNGERVYAYIDRYDELAVDMDTEPYGPNATLLRDEV